MLQAKIEVLGAALPFGKRFVDIVPIERQEREFAGHKIARADDHEEGQAQIQPLHYRTTPNISEARMSPTVNAGPKLAYFMRPS